MNRKQAIEHALEVCENLRGVGIKRFKNTPIVAGLLTDLLVRQHPNIPRQRLLSIGQLEHGSAMWAQCGFATFRLTHSLAAAFLLTDGNDVPINELRFPFDAFSIELPGPDFCLRWRDPEKGHLRTVHSLRVFASPVLREGKTAEVTQYIQKTLRKREASGAEILTAGEEAFAELGADVKTTRLIVSLLDDYDDAAFQIDFDFDEAATVGELLELLQRRSASNALNARGFEVPADDLTAAQQTVSRLIFNTCLYVNSVGVESGEIVRTAPVKRDTAWVTPRVWVFGRDTKLAPEVRRVAAEAVRSGMAHAAWHVEKRFLVRGHWRNQACGPGHKDRRRQWIQPFWKGPQDSIEAVARGYAVDRPEHDA